MPTAKSDYLKWKRDSAAVGCAFARLISARRAEHRQEIVTVTASTTPARIAASVDKQIDKLVLKQEVHAGVLLLPGVTTLEMTAQVVLTLSSRPGWSLAKDLLSHPTAGQLITLGLTRNIPTSGGSHLPSEVLVFGDFPVFPPTRRSPVVAMELFVGVPLDYDPKDGVSVATRANLAHLETPSLDGGARQNMINLSGRMRKRSLGVDEDLRAKARVSISIPIALAQALGCWP